MRRLFFGRRRRRRQRPVNTKRCSSPKLSSLRNPESEAKYLSTPSTTTARIITMSGENYALTSSPIEDKPATYLSSSSSNCGRNRNKSYQGQQQPLRPTSVRSLSSEPTDQTLVRSSTKHERGRLGNMHQRRRQHHQQLEVHRPHRAGLQEDNDFAPTTTQRAMLPDRAGVEPRRVSPERNSHRRGADRGASPPRVHNHCQNPGCGDVPIPPLLNSCLDHHDHFQQQQHSQHSVQEQDQKSLSLKQLLHHPTTNSELIRNNPIMIQEFLHQRGIAIGTYLEDQDTSLPLPARNVNVRQPSRIVSDITLPLELDDNEDDGDHYFSISNSGRFTREDFMTDEQLHHLFSGLEALPLASKERQQQSSTEHSMKYSISSDGGGSDAKIFE